MNKLLSLKKLRKKLSQGQASIGSWMQIPSEEIGEIMGSAKFDWVAIDMEHGSIQLNQLPNLCRSLELGNTLPFVRIPEGNERHCARILDSGAAGIIVPMIESSEQLENIRSACCWPPSGNRGVGFSRANLYGVRFESYSSEAQNPFLIAMIENVNAIENLDKILRVQGLDGIMVGPYDLSASLGITGDFENKLFKKTLNLIKNLAFSNKIPMGYHIVDPVKRDLSLKIKQGFQFLAYGIDSVYLSSSVKDLDINN